jgi:hypothetical protein
VWPKAWSHFELRSEIFEIIPAEREDVIAGNLVGFEGVEPVEDDGPFQVTDINFPNFLSGFRALIIIHTQ